MATARRAARLFLAFLLSLAAISGCGGGSGSYGSPPPPASPPPPPPTFGANFSEIQSNVFTPTCAVSGCHFGPGAQQGLNLEAANSYALLVGIASSESPGVLRVAPGDPENSYLIQKLEGTAAAGGRMPLNGSPLPQATIDTIRQWITDGAIDDRAQAADPIRVTSLSPPPGADLAASPTRIIAGFDRDLDVSTVNGNTFILQSSGGDGTFADGNENAIAADSITVPGANPRSAIFDLGATMLVDETYRVTLKGDGASLLMDLDANALDGEFAGTFPSGDGAAGGDFQADFQVSTPAAPGATLDEIQADVFTPTCSAAGCHTGPTGPVLPAGMDLSDADASFAALVGVASIEQPAISRVASGDPDNSYLVQKLEGTAAVGVRMPFGGPALNAAQIAAIRQWIANGAQR